MRLVRFVAPIAILSCAALYACSDDDGGPQQTTTTSQGGSGAGGGFGAGGATANGGGGGAGGAAPECACDVATYAQDALTNGEQLLNGVTLTASTPIADIVAAPADFDGQLVRIEGFIVEICQSAGCYATVEDCEGNQLNLKVTDFVLDFRDHAELGNYAIGEGVFQPSGSHGAQVFIEDHGAMIGSMVCSGYAGG